ncbi:MAG: molybdenum cofactor guanylyltransferase [Gemmatimonadota bacterium]|nr:MAG: molybdenum cofactor guanylyltransferase [Gemmatimonadota bacterium]
MSQASEPDSHVLAALLAGGRNRRYGGHPKALESVGGELIAARAIRTLQQAVGRVVLVANDVDTYRPLGLEIRPDLRPGLGALGGIHTAVCWAEEAGYRGALVAACDMPFLSAELLRELVRDAAGDEVVAPESGSRRGLEPLCAFYGSGCRAAIEAALDRGDRHVISFFPDVRVTKIPLEVVMRFGDPETLFLNVNTPEDRERAEELLCRTESEER